MKEPKALLVLFNLCSSLPPPSRISYLMFKTVDRITGATHRNQAIMNEAGMMTPVFNALYRSSSDFPLTEQNRHVLRKTFRRMLDIGFCSAVEARTFLKETINGTKINSEVLAILKSGTKSRWPEFFSFHHGGSLVFSDDSGKLFPPPLGFTFLVSHFLHTWKVSYLVVLGLGVCWITSFSKRFSHIIRSKISIPVSVDSQTHCSSRRELRLLYSTGPRVISVSA